MNHAILSAYGVSHSALDKVRDLTLKFGFHSKLTGAGGGGCALTLLRNGNNITNDRIACIYIYIYCRFII